MKETDINEYYHTIKKDITKFIELKFDFFKLEFVEIFSQAYSKIITAWVVAISMVIFTSFILLALGLFLGKLWGAYYLGFLAVSGIFLGLLIIFFLLRKALLTNPMINLLVNVMFEKKIKNENNNEPKL